MNHPNPRFPMNYNCDTYIDRKMAYVKGLVGGPLYDAGDKKTPWRDTGGAYALKNNPPQDYMGDNIHSNYRGRRGCGRNNCQRSDVA